MRISLDPLTIELSENRIFSPSWTFRGSRALVIVPNVELLLRNGRGDCMSEPLRMSIEGGPKRVILTCKAKLEPDQGYFRTSKAKKRGNLLWSR